MIDRGQLCDAAGARRAVRLPLRTGPGLAPGEARYNLRIAAAAPPEIGPGVPTALYLPNVNTASRVTVDGITAYTAPGPLRRLWNRPVLVDLPKLAPAGRTVAITVALRVPAQQGIEIWPIYLGAAPALRATDAARLWQGIELARFVQGLAALLLFGHLAVYLATRGEQGHLGLALASAMAVIFVAQFAGDAPPLSYARWTPIWMLAIFAYVFLVMRFVFERLHLDYPRLRRGALSFLVVAALGIAVIPANAALAYGLSRTGGTVVISFTILTILTILWYHRLRIGRWHFTVYFLCFSAAVGLGMLETVATAAPFPVVRCTSSTSRRSSSCSPRCGCSCHS